MRTPDRLKLRRQIAVHLKDESWGVIDEVLHSFGAPTNTSWRSEDAEGYVLGMTRDISASQLLEMAEACGITIAEVAPRELSSDLWKSDGLRVFLSHTSAHKVLCTEVSSILRDFGAICFVAHDAIEPEVEWQSEIERALRTCDCLVGFLTKDFCASKWTDQELGFALARAVPVVGIRMPEDPHGFLGKSQGLSVANHEPQTIATTLYKRWTKRDALRIRLAEGMMSSLENARTFGEANDVAENLAKLGDWDGSFNNRVIAAYKSNTQVSGGFKVARALRHLVEGSGGIWPG